jgi:hypothetical protein
MTTTMMKSVLVLAAALVGLSAGCMTGNGVYEMNAARSMATSFEDQTLFRAVEQAAAAEGWTVHERNLRSGRLEIHEPVDGSEGFVTRQRWVVQVSDGTVSARMYLDFMEDGRWKKYDLVCDGYGYSQEFTFLETVERTAHETTTARTASNH